ncbi:MAG: FGGY family carbohydrate kinase [Candidatus Hodarchaeota archaeon]
MTFDDKESYSVGIDIGTSGIRLLVLNTKGMITEKQMVNYKSLNDENWRIWDDEKRIDVIKLRIKVVDLLKTLSNSLSKIKIKSLGISSIGPSILLLSNKAEPITNAYTYAYEGAQDYVKYLKEDFQERTGSLYSGALPYVQLLKIAEEGLIKECSKITTINDYINWYMTGLSLEKIFSTIPNASYTGLYSLKEENWDKELLSRLGLKMLNLPIIVPLGTKYSLREDLKSIPMFQKTLIVTGTIDGIDAFWATESRNEKTLVGSASTTGALRKWRNKKVKHFKSRLIQCVQVSKDTWVELIPFNNVGTSFTWLATNFRGKYKKYLTKTNHLDIRKLEFESKKRIEYNKNQLSDYLLKIPLYFPYIEGEPRGPNARGKIKGGFILKENINFSCLDLYISLVIGISNMYRHNFEMIDSSSKFSEIRLTGLIARKSPLFLQFLATLTNLNVIVMKTEQSVAWATAMRALNYVNEIEIFPEVPIYDPILPMKGEIKKILNSLYSEYMTVYISPDNYDMIISEEELNY